MITTEELIERLHQYHEDYSQGCIQNFFNIYDDCEEAAVRLRQLQQIINDMTNDHYVDYLEFYANRCRELEEKMSEILSIISGENNN